MKYLLKNIALMFICLTLLSPGLALAAIDREQEVRDAVTAFVTTRTAGMGWDVSMRRISISGVVKLPEGAVDYEVIAPQKWEGWGHISVAVLARQNDKVLRNIPVRVDVEALADTVVALHQIGYGTIITSADLVLQKREISYSSLHTARTIAEVVGKKARTTLRANQPVRSDQIEKIPLIKSGQLVTIIAENGVMKVSVTGKAHSSGAEGDVVRVQNLTSLKEIPAKIIDAATVQVAF